jgi:hypothetical protein
MCVGARLPRSNGEFDTTVFTRRAGSRGFLVTYDGEENGFTSRERSYAATAVAM